MKNHNLRSFLIPGLVVIFFLCAVSPRSLAQVPPRAFDWVPSHDESVRLDPANYHSGETYQAGAYGAKNHVDIKAERPVTVFMTPADDWSQALQHPETIPNLRQVCPAEHVVETTYVCNMPPGAFILVIRDERNNPDAAVFAGMGAVLNPNDKAQRAIGEGIATIFTGEGSATRRFKAPNDLHIQYYNWNCVQNCIQPEFRWMDQVKEKYELTSFLKVYGGFRPDHDAEQISIKIKSPVPMVVAVLPSQMADQLHSQPDALESALQKTSCQQRGVQSLQFECTFNLADGPQSLIVAPEAGTEVPRKKKAEIEMLAARCVENCQILQTAAKQ
jgi:hypothetical protein